MHMKKGSYLTGSIGAFLGALVASIPFTIAYRFGYIVFLFAILFMTFSMRGYNKLGGRIGYLKIFIVGFFGFSGVILSVFGPVIGIFYEMAVSYPEVSVWDIPYMIYLELVFNSKFRMGMIKELALPLILAFVGWFYVIKETIGEVSAYKQMQAHNAMTMQYQSMNGGYDQTFGMPQGMPNTAEMDSSSMPTEQSCSPMDSFDTRNRMANHSNQEENHWYQEEEMARRPEE